MNLVFKNNVRACIIGRGNMGSKIQCILNELQVKNISVDPARKDAQYRLLTDIPKQDFANISHWFICVPTDLHFKVLSQISSRVTRGCIMIEKPIGTTNDLSKYRMIAELQPNLNICVNNHYEECGNLIRARKMLDNNQGDLRHIVIDFSKSRLRDIESGRSIDNHYMIWGYEGHHMIYLASQLLSKKDQTDFLYFKGNHVFNRGNNSHVSWVDEHTILPSGSTVTLRTSTDGSTGYNGPIKFLRPDQRKRHAYVQVKDGISVNLIFAECQKNKFMPSDDFSFSLGYNTPIWNKENPLKNHIIKFLRSSAEISRTFDLGLLIADRLGKMSRYTYAMTTK